MKPTAIIYLDKRKKIKTGENQGRYHIKILVTFNVFGKRQRFYYKTKVFATEKEYKTMAKGTKDQDLTDRWAMVKEIKDKADDIIRKEEYLTPETFENKFTSAGSYRDPLGLMKAMVDELIQEGRAGNAITFKQSISSLKLFAGDNLTFIQITPKWLKKYEKWAIDKGLSITTVGIYLRPLRAVFNQERGKTIPHEMYPFREKASQKDKYKIPTGKGRKLALDEAQKNKLLEFKSRDLEVQKAVDFWIMSYFCNGLNFLDIAKLKVKQIDGRVMYAKRSKTMFTDRDQKEITIPIREEVRKIIRKYGINSLDPNEYVFPILKSHYTANQVKNRVRNWIRETNEGLKKACEALKIPVVTTYSARHTFATMALRKGASVEHIQEALGHADSKTTKAYLNGFDFEVKKAISDKL